jgi:hypothetical protein
MSEKATMRPGEVRREVLAQHAGLRQLMEEARRTALDVLGGDEALAPLRVAYDRLAERLVAHLRYEEERLVPILVAAGVFGPVRRERMRVDHAYQRRLVGEIARDCSEAPLVARALAAKVRRLVVDLLDDMAFEEGVLLREEALRDDAGAVGPER